MLTKNAKIRTLRIAAVQMQSRLGDIPANLAHATTLVEQAAAQGAQLIALPELAASGYSLSDAIWEAGETRDGLTIRWLKQTSARLGVYLGIGFLEVEGEEFFNSFAIGAPDGQIAGIVRKTMAETGCFRCSNGPHVIETALGRIGVGICADNLFAPNLHKMQAGSADLLLMPHAAPVPYRTGGLVDEKDISRTHQTLSQMAPRYARLTGIPVVFINQVGPRGPEKWLGILGGIMSPESFKLGGLSTISTLDGTVVGQLDDCAESVAIADVTLDGARKIAARPAGHGSYGGGFVTPHPLLFELLCYVDAFYGRMHYQFSAVRRAKARGVSAPTA
jgi:N-carbamoylputrescine amidase